VVRKLKTKSGKGQNDILKQAQEMQKKMLEIQEGLKEKELEISVGGGAVTARVNAQKELLGIKLSDDIVKEAAEDNDKEMLEDLIVSAVKEAMRQAEEVAEKEMESVTGGMSIPGLV
jgi:DNA-binding YbaB/EbfC family protein